LTISPNGRQLMRSPRSRQRTTHLNMRSCARAICNHTAYHMCLL